VLESNPNPNHHQPKSLLTRRLIQALIVLCVAIAGLAIRDFWFSPETDSDLVGTEVPQSKANPTIPSTVQAKTPEKTKAPAPAPAKKLTAKTTPQPQPQAQTQATAQPMTPPAAHPAQSGAVASNRASVPPLDIEVIAGDKKTTVHPRSNATDLAVASSQPAAPASNAAERAPLSTTVPVPAPFVDGAYPVLAQQMKVRGSVVLQALIGSDGVIQDLRVMAGPGILATAAREAVRSWHFKPFLVNGQPVETKAKITVNFTINVADTTASGS
jgi:TonB family protein